MTEKRRDMMSEQRLEATNGHSGTFLKGLFAVALVGTAAGILFAPQAYAALRSLRRQLTGTAADVGDRAAERCREATAQVNDAVDDLHERGRGAYGKVVSAVARGAQDIKNHATDAQTELSGRL